MDEFLQFDLDDDYIGMIVADRKNGSNYFAYVPYNKIEMVLTYPETDNRYGIRLTSGKVILSHSSISSKEAYHAFCVAIIRKLMR